jgi:hypothetical protein
LAYLEACSFKENLSVNSCESWTLFSGSRVVALDNGTIRKATDDNGKTTEPGITPFDTGNI